MDIYAHRRDPEYGFPAYGTLVEFEAESDCSFLELFNYEAEGKAIPSIAQREGILKGDDVRTWLQVRNFTNNSLNS